MGQEGAAGRDGRHTHTCTETVSMHTSALKEKAHAHILTGNAEIECPAAQRCLHVWALETAVQTSQTPWELAVQYTTAESGSESTQ